MKFLYATIQASVMMFIIFLGTETVLSQWLVTGLVCYIASIVNFNNLDRITELEENAIDNYRRCNEKE